jgi:hypothetical protein
MHFLLETVNDVGTTYTEAVGESWWSSLFWYLVTAAGLWPMLVKAGIPGWGALIPIWNIYLQIKLAGRSGALILLYLIPFVNIVVAVVVALGTARAFGKGAFYGFFLHFLLQPLGFLITGYGSSRYTAIVR